MRTRCITSGSLERTRAVKWIWRASIYNDLAGDNLQEWPFHREARVAESGIPNCLGPWGHMKLVRVPKGDHGVVQNRQELPLPGIILLIIEKLLLKDPSVRLILF